MKIDISQVTDIFWHVIFIQKQCSCVHSLYKHNLRVDGVSQKMSKCHSGINERMMLHNRGIVFIMSLYLHDKRMLTTGLTLGLY